MTSVVVIPFAPDRRTELLDLMETVWGSYMSPAEWEWWFTRNPAGHALISLAESGGQLVGAAAMSWFEMNLDGKIERVPMPGHVATHPDHRGRGIFSALELENERRAMAIGSSVAVTFPNQASRAVFVGRLGWADLRFPRVWVRLLPFARSPEGIDRIARFQSRSSATRPGTGSIARTVRYLNWRFIDTPRSYESLAGDDCHAVLGVTSIRGMRVRFLAEFAAPATIGSKLLRAVLAASRPAPAILAMEPSPEHRATFLSLGFVPTPKRMPFLGKVLAEGGALPRMWRLTLGDLDFL